MNERILSKAKEIFLALCLISKEVPQTVVRQMEKDYGSNIRKTVIYKLKTKGYIKKVGLRGNYGFTITEKGNEYIRKHFAEKYNCDLYRDYYLKLSYQENTRLRNQALCCLLYYMVRHNISITNHLEEFVELQNSQQGSEKTYFITSKEVRNTHPRYNIIKGSKFYGILVTPQALYVIYYPDNQQLQEKTEGLLEEVLEVIYKNSYYNGKIYPIFFFDNEKNLQMSFVNDISKMGSTTMSTRLYYTTNKYGKNKVCIMNDVAGQIQETIDEEFSEKVIQVFKDYYNLTPVDEELRISEWADGMYEKETLTVILNDIDPHKIVKLNQYIRETHRKGLVLCYDDQVKTIKEVFKLNQSVFDRLLIATLPRNEVKKYITGETHSLE